jgi:hypothetical protein
MDNEKFIELLYRIAVECESDRSGLSHYVAELKLGRDPLHIFEEVFSRNNLHKSLCLFARPGHFYSPIVDPALIAEAHCLRWKTPPDNLPGISIDGLGMAELWLQWLPTMMKMPFYDDKRAEYRYYYRNNFFAWGDACVYYSILTSLRPRRIVEVGSGFTSALALDVIDRYLESSTSLILIEPSINKLEELLWPDDFNRVEIYQFGVETLGNQPFRSLAAGDVLFIDSTHVLKTCSDVHFILFDILPRLPAGIYIHFHDVFYPFEYPPEWINEQNRSWNEAYALRAFLMYNHNYRIMFYSDYFRRKFPTLAENTAVPFYKNTGASLWLQKVQ